MDSNLRDAAPGSDVPRPVPGPLHTARAILARAKSFLAKVLAIVALAGPASAAAGSGGWERLAVPIFRHLTPTDGLPYPLALALAQDAKGFMWFGTPGGLARWDGHRMDVFHPKANVADSLPENIVTNLMTDKKGQLWLSTSSGVVARYDPAHESFIAYRNEHGAGVGAVSAMADDGAGGIWVGLSSGLAHLDPTSGRWQREGCPRAGNSGCGVRSILLDRAGNLWIGTDAGLLERKSGSAGFDQAALPTAAARSPVTALFQGVDGVVRFGTKTGLVGAVSALGRGEMILPPSGHAVTAMVEYKQGVLWVGEFGGGIRELSIVTGQVRAFRHDPSIAGSLGDDTVSGMLIDRSGLVWASGQRGVDITIPINHQVLTLSHGTAGGLPGQDVRSMAATVDGKLWLGFRSEGLARLDPVSGEVTTIHPGASATGLPPERIQAIAAMPDGEVWAGLSNGLYRIDARTGRAEPFEALKGRNIRTLLYSAPYLWVGGTMGVARIGPQDGSVAIFSHDPANAESLSDNSVYSLFRDSKGRLLVGTVFGLNLLTDPIRGTFRHIMHDAADPLSLPSDTIISVAEDRHGRLWVTTANGIGIGDPDWRDQPRFSHHVGVAEGLPADTVLTLAAADDGSMVAGTGGGMVTIDPETLQVRDFGPADGMGIRTFWAGSCAKLPDGTVAMGGFDGMVVVRSGPLPHWTFDAPVAASRVRIAGRQVPPGETIIVGPQDQGFDLEFSALDYSAPERIRYEYRLEGSQEEWTPTDAAHRTATYTNLTPGHYRLVVRGSNSDGVWSTTPLVQKVRVLPAWYQTNWFRLLAACAFLAAVAAAAQARSAVFRRRSQELSRLVEARTRDVVAAREAAEAADQAKARFLAVIGHEIRTPLNGLLGMLQLLEPDSLGSDQRRSLNIAKDAGEGLRQLVESVLQYGQQDAIGGTTTTQDIDLRRVVNEALELFRPQADTRGIVLVSIVEPEGPLWVKCSGTGLNRILLNLLSNAFKFTSAGSVTVRVALERESDRRYALSLSVTDTGVGIPTNMLDAIFGDFVQGDDSVTRQFGGAGLGLAICRRIATQMGGRLTVGSSLGEGSTFTLSVPVEAGAPAGTMSVAAPIGPSQAVLVVDDDVVNLEVARAFLTRLGHRVTAVDTGSAAVQAAASQDFDAVLTDLRMPNMDGLEVARRIRNLPVAARAEVRIIAVTAELNAEVQRDCAGAGIEAIVAKPITMEALRRIIPVAQVTVPLAPSVPHGFAPLDLQYLASQRELLGMDELMRLARLFRVTTCPLLAEMQASALANDRAALKAAAHRLRSAAGALGMVELTGDAARLETGLATLSSEQLSAAIAQIRQSRYRAMAALIKAARVAGKERTALPDRSGR